MRENGGNAHSEAAVAAGLKWLARHQAPDGHWGLHDFNDNGKCNCTGPGLKHDVAATALALLPFLGAGESHKGTRYAKVVERALKWLLVCQKENGAFSNNGYEHALATLAICEDYSLTADPWLKGPAQRAVDCCVAWQHPAGGFRYTSRSPGDLSVTNWFLQALIAANSGALKIPDSTWIGINKYLDSVSNTDGSGYGYQGRKPTPTMTAAGILCRVFIKGPRYPSLPKAINNIRRELPSSTAKPNTYYYYHATQAVFHTDEVAWKKWNPKMRDLLIDRQDQGTDTDHRDQKGSWPVDDEPYGKQLGRLGCTAFALLTLETYYRYLPIHRTVKPGK